MEARYPGHPGRLRNPQHTGQQRGHRGFWQGEDTTESSWDRQMDIHAKGVFLGTKHAIPPMREAGGGSIVNISSIFGIIGSRGSTDYHAAKGASRIFTKSAAVQLARDGIRGELGASRLLPYADE